ncbi:MAG: glycosyltransferase family 1 protein [Steroidobacteraceae bacterium]
MEAWLEIQSPHSPAFARPVDIKNLAGSSVAFVKSKMMRIAFDYQTFSLQTYGGISRYFVRLAERLLMKQQEVGIFAPLYRNRYANDLPPEVIHGRRVERYPPKSTRLFVQLNRMIAKPMIRHWRPHLVHETYYARSASAPASCPSVVTVYDMIHELFPMDFPATDRTSTAKRIAIERAAHVICISKSTRNDLLNLFDVSEDKVSVVYLGFERFPVRHQHADTTSRGPRPFLLYVGNRVGYKNFSGLLAAVASSHKLIADVDIVAFGGGKFSANEESIIAKLGFRDGQVRQVEGDDRALGMLYDQALAFVYPSLYEGFGLPPLEAMAHGCPVISSNTSSMPEVIGDAGVYFEPSSIEEMAMAIERVVYSSELAGELIERGSRRLDLFTWEGCADRTLDIYQKLVGKR